jgi:hypothetical protein
VQCLVSGACRSKRSRWLNLLGVSRWRGVSVICLVLQCDKSAVLTVAERRTRENMTLN